MKLFKYLLVVLLLFHFIDVKSQEKINNKLTNIEMAYPFWTPDGEKIVFQSNWSGNWDIFIMDADGTNIQQLTFNKSNQITPTVSHDGKWISYVSDEIGNNEIYLMDIKGGNNSRITNSEAEDIHPFWHPTNHKLIFNSTRATAGTFEIFEFNLNEERPTRITYNKISETFASWSPDGSKLAYVKWDNDSGNIFIMDYISKTEIQLTKHEEFDGWPTWYSNDEIIFASFRTNPAQIFKINIDSQNVTQLTDNDEENARPNVWQNKLIYNGKKNGTMNIYLKKLE